MKKKFTELNPTIGRRLKAARARAGISQKPIVKALNTSVQTVSKYENDHIEKVPARVIKVYAELTGVTTDYLQGLVNDPYAKLSDTLIKFAERKTDTALSLINLASGVRFEQIDDNLFQVQEVATGKNEPEGFFVNGKEVQVTATRDDIVYLSESIINCMKGIVNSYINCFLLGRAVGDGKHYVKREDSDLETALNTIL